MSGEPPQDAPPEVENSESPDATPIKPDPDGDPASAPSRVSSVKFQSEEPSPKPSPETDPIKSEADSEAENPEPTAASPDPDAAGTVSQTGPSAAPSGDIPDSPGSQEKTEPSEATSAADATPPEQEGAAVGGTGPSSSDVPPVTEYVEAEDGNIHINEEQKAAIRRLMQPDEQDDLHLGFTKQGKPIKANPYFKYALRAGDGAEDTKPAPAPVTEPHASRLTRRSRRDSAHLPMGPSIALEKMKEEFCEWLASLGSRRNLTVSKERLEELFSLGLENNLVVRPPEVRMTQPGRCRPRPSSQTAQPAPRQTPQPSDHHRHKRVSSVAYCRSPSLTYYPELKEKWRQMGLSRQRPVWRPGHHGGTPPPPPPVRYGDWYIPIRKWTPLVGGRRLAPPETDEARQLRKRELANRKLNEVLSRSHALSALREYIRICQLHGDPAFPEATPKLVRDVDQVVAAMALETRASQAATRHRTPRASSVQMAGLMVRLMEPGQRKRSSMEHRGRRPTEAPDRGPLMTRPPPRYKPVKTAPGPAAARRR